MAARKLQQEVDKCFKKVAEGVAEFDAIYEKIGQSNNTAQKEKLEDNLKREIKKLQRLRDQIKTWAAGNEIKDKGPLMENRRLIETQMERFKAVEKAMKTKAYSKEGLSAATKLDPREQAKHEASEFLSQQVDELEQQIESLEAERESIQATVKRGKLHGAKAERMARIDTIIDRHKWHQGKLELIRRSLENGGVEVDQVNELDESIRYYVTDGMNDDFMEDESIYDDLNLEDDDGFGAPADGDKSSQDNHSVQGDFPAAAAEQADTKSAAATSSAPAASGSSSSNNNSNSNSNSKGRQSAAAAAAAGGSGAADTAASSTSNSRRSAAQLKSPLPTVATLHTPLPTLSNGVAAAAAGMKPASIPARPAGETLKYASAAAAAAASDKLGLGIAPLPPPVSVAAHTSKNLGGSAANSPKPASAQPAGGASDAAGASPAVSHAATATSSGSAAAAAASSKAEPAPRTARGKAAAAAAAAAAATAAAAAAAAAATPASSAAAPTETSESSSKAAAHTNGTSSGARSAAGTTTTTAAAGEDEERDGDDDDEEESIYHLPESLRELVDAYEVTKARKTQAQTNPEARLRMLAQSSSNPPDAFDAEPARRYFPEVRYASAFNFPHEPLPLLDDPRLYSRVDPDTLFYVFYYKQGTYQQYLAAKALKDMSWRFHKQYQTWFQRHEEPKSITEEFEQGTYRFFDYESTWMNRRKADFKFVYKYLEDDV